MRLRIYVCIDAIFQCLDDIRQYFVVARSERFDGAAATEYMYEPFMRVDMLCRLFFFKSQQHLFIFFWDFALLDHLRVYTFVCRYGFHFKISWFFFVCIECRFDFFLSC